MAGFLNKFRYDSALTFVVIDKCYPGWVVKTLELPIFAGPARKGFPYRVNTRLYQECVVHSSTLEHSDFIDTLRQ